MRLGGIDREAAMSSRARPARGGLQATPFRKGRVVLQHPGSVRLHWHSEQESTTAPGTPRLAAERTRQAEASPCEARTPYSSVDAFPGGSPAPTGAHGGLAGRRGAKSLVRGVLVAARAF